MATRVTDLTGAARTDGPRSARDAAIVAGAALVGALLTAALVRGATLGFPRLQHGVPLWLGLHMVAVAAALPLGVVVLLRRKGDARHRAAGRAWAVLMLLAAGSSLFSRGLASFGVIHILSLLILVTVPLAIVNARAGRIARHRRGMTGAYIGLVIAGLFVFLPDRLLGLWLYG